MPFINDMLDDNQVTTRHQKAHQTKKMATRFLFEPEEIAVTLKELMVGQDAIIDQVCDFLFRVKADIIEPNKPLMVVALIGPTGVGKTQLVNHIARLILGSEKKLCRIDMNTLTQSHYSAAVTGAPPGYAGSKENHTLFDSEAILGTYSCPSIVLLDEIEKADKSVCRSLLNILDNGQLDLSSGNKTIDFSNSLIFMTSNIGSQALLNQNTSYLLRFFDKKPFNWCKSTIKTKIKSIEKTDNKSEKNAFHALEKHFEPEFINRIESFLFFKPISHEHIHTLINIECQNLNKRITNKNYQFIFSPACIKTLKSSYQQQFGARNIRHRIRTDIEPCIARLILSNASSGVNIKPTGYLIDWNNGFIITAT